MGDLVLCCPECQARLVRRVVWQAASPAATYVNAAGDVVAQEFGRLDVACPCCKTPLRFPTFGWRGAVQLLPLADLEVK